MPYKNKEDQLESQRRHYQNNKDKVYLEVKQRRKELSQWFYNYKSTLKCENCGFNNQACLDFHHTNNKFMEVGKMVRDGYSKLKILEEIKNCIVLCANCHRILHYEERYQT